MPTLTVRQLKRTKRTLTLQIKKIEGETQSKIKPMEQQLDLLQAQLKLFCPHKHFIEANFDIMTDFWCDDCGSSFSWRYNQEDKNYLQQRGIIRIG